MTRFVIGWVGAVALASAACAGQSRAAKANTNAPQAASGTANATSAGNATSTGNASPAATARTAERTVEGRVEQVDRANHVTVAGTESVGLAFDKFQVDDATQITVDGQPAHVADVNEGDAVRASFSGPDDAPHLDRLDVQPSGQ